MSKPQHADDGTYCPLWRKSCHKVCHTCKWYNLVRGKHPQTNEDVDRWDCAMSLLPMLQIENAMVGRQTTASVDAMRQEVRQSSDQAMAGAIAQLNRDAQLSRDIALASLVSAPSPATKLIEN